MRWHWKFFFYMFTINFLIVYHRAQQFNNFYPNNRQNNFNSFPIDPNKFELNAHIHGNGSENTALRSPTDLKISISINSNQRNVNRNYILEYEADEYHYRAKVEIEERPRDDFQPRGFAGGFGGGGADALSPDTLKSGGG
uniref:Uncharacterized protein n=1 Tax=Glossina brevipalpis TaxID=37001 RepID=A0A1A9WAI5_9MUSC